MIDGDWKSKPPANFATVQMGDVCVMISKFDNVSGGSRLKSLLLISMITSYLSFWGKAAKPGGPVPANGDWHPAAYHMLDVAAVASVWLEACNPRIPGFKALDETAWPAIVTLIALHDVGKFSLSFQAQRRELWPACLGPIEHYPGTRHDTAGYHLLRKELLQLLQKPVFGPMEYFDRDQLLRAVCGHHGSPPLDDNRSSNAYNQLAVNAAEMFVTDVLALLAPQPFPEMEEDDVTALAWWLAGLTVLADWVGSSETWFEYYANNMTLREYWPIACDNAKRAVRQAGLNRISPAGVPPLVDLLNGQAGTPVQCLTDSLDLGPADQPALVIIEDQTGSGKTEAALNLAHRLMAEKGARGLFIALPTMATANALHERLSQNYRALFAPQTEPSLVLAHGKRKLIDRFTQALQRGAWVTEDRVSENADETASAQCAAWLGRDRRRGFMAECGVGTIDQALHAVLPTRHAPLRLFGLSQRVLIIDEAHAYDAYMETEIFRLLEFQTRQGGSTIILSATLPQTTRRKWLKAFDARLECVSLAYPLVTVASGGAVAEHAVGPRAALARELNVRRLPDAEAAMNIVRDAARRGAAVGWVRNTVTDAIAAHAMLIANDIEATLFHARFAMGDRLEIERQVQDRFDKKSAGAQRAHVVVGTQVMEQSLDLDFDVLISDLAPVDLLLQRAGRLWRHVREAPRPEAMPVLYVIAPEAVAAPAADWLKDFAGTAAVYQDHGILWRSARAMFEHPVVRVPGDVRRLVEFVYAQDAETPPGLEKSSEKAKGKAQAAQAMGWQNLLEWHEGYAQGAGAWASDVKTPTRLSEPSYRHRLGIWEHGAIRPVCPQEDIDKSWPMSEINLPIRLAKTLPEETGARKAALVALRAGWSRWEQEVPVLLLEPDGSGCVIDGRDRPRAVHYSGKGGLVFAAT